MAILAGMSATDKIKNAIDDAAGKAKEAAGNLTDDDQKKNEGKADQAKADLKDAGEKVKDAFKH
ncbi:CsbD family protein [Mycolicibacterium fallax]|nr:CsbD family protein [Mycolicibacterium fallax]